MLPTFIDPALFGVSGNGDVDDAPALQSAIDSAGAGSIVRLGPGVFRLATSLVLNRPVILQGSGGAGDSPATTLKSDGGVTALLVSRALPGGDWAVIRDVAFRSTATGKANGIELRARAAIYDCNISGFSGDGVLVDSTAPGDNANNWLIQHCRITGCGGSGVRAVGGDSNAGLAIGIDATGNGAWGFDDDSFLGCTFLACHAAANTAGAFRSGQLAANTLLLGCYSESDQLHSMLTPKSVVVGGTHGAPLRGAGGAPVTLTGGANSPHAYTSWLTGLRIQVGSGEGDTSGGILSCTDAAGRRAYLKYMGSNPPAYGVGTNIFGWNVENGPTWAFSISGRNSSFAVQPEGVGRPVADASFNFPGGFYLQGHRVVMAPAPPTSGSWLVGDEVRNAAPAADGFAGWLCTQAGDFMPTAPVFRPFGRIE